MIRILPKVPKVDKTKKTLETSDTITVLSICAFFKSKFYRVHRLTKHLKGEHNHPQTELYFLELRKLARSITGITIKRSTVELSTEGWFLCVSRSCYYLNGIDQLDAKKEKWKYLESEHSIRDQNMFERKGKWFRLYMGHDATWTDKPADIAPLQEQTYKWTRRSCDSEGERSSGSQHDAGFVCFLNKCIYGTYVGLEEKMEQHVKDSFMGNKETPAILNVLIVHRLKPP